MTFDHRVASDTSGIPGPSVPSTATSMLPTRSSETRAGSRRPPSSARGRSRGRRARPVRIGSEDPRSEPPAERLDRNLEEMTGELRVVVTGVQVLFAFLLIVPFNSGFSGIGGFERGV